MKREFFYTETTLRWWQCWQWMFAKMAVIRLDYSGTGYLVPLETAKAICKAHNTGAPEGAGGDA